jgi:hypothetical protein
LRGEAETDIAAKNKNRDQAADCSRPRNLLRGERGFADGAARDDIQELQADHSGDFNNF